MKFSVKQAAAILFVGGKLTSCQHILTGLMRDVFHDFLQGDGNVRYYELSDSEPYFTFLNEYRSSSPQRGFGVMPKRGLDVTACEIYRFYKLHNNNFVEPIAMTVPRRVSTVQIFRKIQI